MDIKHKKILLATAAFYPENSPRSLRASELAKEFVRQGHEVTVMTVGDNEQTQIFCSRHSIKLISLSGRLLKPVRIPSKGVGNIFWRIINRFLLLFFEYPDIELLFKFKKGLEDLHYYDMLISFAVPYPVHWGVAFAKKRNKTLGIWIADCGDPYMGLENDPFKRPFYFNYFEILFCSQANFISVPIKEAIAAYYPQFHSKIRIIPQGFSFPKEEECEVKNEIPTFVYAGNIGSYQHYAKPFFNLLHSHKGEFCFKVYTNTPWIFEDGLRNIMGKVLILPYLERETLLRELRKADFLVYFPYKHPTQRSMKLIDYGYSNRPILKFTAISSDELIFKEFMNGNYAGKLLNEGIEQYRIENVCEKFLTLIREDVK